ncbi:rubredoxin [Candidimonas sp. SYP-B2681]|uniref:rubredoxin n=1 Tax=Candidimonas sp. SYP-B2681 TaxID=2497686 RepID=UPI000F887EAF|nr:rubredoxin [Candidimonas sp. SYP-B2681]RTZ45481.1 rubredoxin [Candidimonas sp. SYP-B2681]
MENSNSLNVDTAGSESTEYKTWQCILCGFIYEEAEGIPEEGIPAGTRWADVPEDWVCPECSAPKADFEMIEI